MIPLALKITIPFHSMMLFHFVLNCPKVPPKNESQDRKEGSRTVTIINNKIPKKDDIQNT